MKLALTLVTLAACQGPDPAELLPQIERSGRLTDVSLGDGAVHYRGFTQEPDPVQPGQVVHIRHLWEVRRPPGPVRIFVHPLLQGARGWVQATDHAPPAWPASGAVVTEQALVIPKIFPDDRLELRLGLWDGAHRLAVIGHGDGEDRIRAGYVHVAAPALLRPRYLAAELQSPPRLDGRITDKEWGDAPWTEPFGASHGRGPARSECRARLAWDRTHLYIAMQTADPDLSATLTQRDAPLYREEALEVFLDPDGDGSDYLELQTNPLGAQFDARFHGGPRQGMDVGWNARYATAVMVDGTLNHPGDLDRGWSAEWAIELDSLPEGPRVAAGVCWRVNLFHVGKDQQGGVVRADESAWSPPLQGDFHNLERFGDLCFHQKGP